MTTNKNEKSRSMAIAIAACIVLALTVCIMLVVRHGKAEVMECTAKTMSFSGFVITSNKEVMVTFDGDPGLLNIPSVWGYKLFTGGVYSDPTGKGDLFIRMSPTRDDAE